uniref:Uncharacterized protein n=1 Tax=Sphenodon punctatus TaxID=8508 RepID=A0A8D0H075_SPHPU
DRNNVLVVRREVALLKKRLQDSKVGSKPSPRLAPPSYGSCDHGGLSNVSKPFVVQLNWRGASYKYGGWGRDAAMGATERDLFWVAPLNADGRIMEVFRLHAPYND